MLMPPWLRDASSPDRAPGSSLQEEETQIHERGVTSGLRLKLVTERWRRRTLACMARRAEAGCAGPAGRSFWSASLRAWRSRCLDSWWAERGE